MEDGRVEITEVDFALDRSRTGLVGFAVDEAAFDATAGHPEGEAVGVVSGLVFPVAGGEAGTSEFSAPDNEGVFEEPALLEVFEERGDGGVGRFAVRLEVAAMVGMLVPAPVIDLDETHPGFGKAAREETLAPEVRHLAGPHRTFLSPHPVAGEGPGRFVAEVEQIRCGHLHAESELHRLDHALEFGVAGALREMPAVHHLHEVELTALRPAREMGAGDIVNRGLCHFLPVHADGGAVVDRGQEGARVGRGARGIETDESGQILIFRSESVTDPRTEAGPFAEPVAGVELEEGLGMDPGVGVHAVEEAELVGVFGRLGHEFGNTEAAPAVLFEVVDRAGMRFFPGLRFVVKGIELGGAAAHAEEDDPFGPGREGSGTGSQLRLSQSRKGEVAESAGGGLEHAAA